MDHADQAPARQFRHPPGALTPAKTVYPAPNPGLRPFARGGVTNSGHIIQPDKAMAFLFKRSIRYIQIPQHNARGLYQMARKQDVTSGQLAPACKTANGSWFRLRNKSSCWSRTRQQPRVKAVHQARPPRRPAFWVGHLCCLGRFSCLLE